MIPRIYSDRYLGQEWLVRTEGSFLPGVFEEVVCTEYARTLTPKNALHVKATDNYTDQFGKKRWVGWDGGGRVVCHGCVCVSVLGTGHCRKVGDEWLVTFKDTSSYIPAVTEVCGVGSL